MSETETKSRPASANKLRKLWQEGIVPRSSELAGFVAVAVGVVMLFAMAGGILVAATELVDIAEEAIRKPSDEALRGMARDIAVRFFGVVAPVAGVTVFTAIVVAIIYHGGVPLSAKPLAPQLERMSPAQGLKQLFGRRGLIETAATFVRVLLWFLFAGLAGLLLLPGFAAAVQCGFPCQAQAARLTVWVLGLGLVLLLLLSAGFDMILQRALFLFEQRMTASEVGHERRESYGDPQIKAARRSRLREEPPDPSAIGAERANICFFAGDRAIGVRYHPQQAKVPRVAAKLSAGAAEQFRARLAQAGLPVVESHELVAGCQAVELGVGLPTALYEVFATTLRAAM
jgi:type III secretion protein U